MLKFSGDGYGEITDVGTDVLIRSFPKYFNNPDGVFYDLGSGKGKLSMYIASNTPLKKVCGIELHTARCNEAKEKSKDLKLNQLSFIESNFGDCDVSDATIVYTDNIAMPKPILTELYQHLPKGCLVITTKKFLTGGPRGLWKKTGVIEKTYTSRRFNWYIIK
jgi:ubiquinone/menaquinone biosynthesis C-methylase UbiE